MPFPVSLEPKNQFPRQDWSSLKFSLKSKWKNPSNIGIKLPDMEWENTGRNVRPPASNEITLLSFYRMLVSKEKLFAKFFSSRNY